ncbi:hypothetical protein GII33_21175 [Gordonia pseudamarae]|jgi:hypothetical protein|uniref:Uncharacterized protein n=1 Tax=Gordonia pseudamarae TaxID=2831662 RepID=A0ABX6IM27_9ACTN|nr:MULTISPECIES: hypothetical protein [Gordonia]MBD0023805.1 hypothetical protein [Gordonia sp. (in: high G+C Gram-positive bacteria)]QHN28109.1 hypothetical protein GII33_21175 [Gordonia pseudamarae]QHN36972.1 hypothetical protein GII31_20810 [Gordonia pseudamarae]
MTAEIETMLPLYEAKMIAAYDHRAADVVKSETATKRQNQPRYLTTFEHQDVTRVALPYYWVAEEDMPEREDEWLLAFLRITSATNHRTFISSALPWSAAGDSVFLAHADTKPSCLLACFNSFVFDFVSRQKISGLNMLFYIVRQLPVPTPQQLAMPFTWTGDKTIADWIDQRVLELTYTAHDMQDFGESLNESGEVFVWDEDRRSYIRAELDAAFFRLYGIERDDVDYIMDTFPIVKRKDEAEHGEYHTKRLILEVYDRMSDLPEQRSV